MLFLDDFLKHEDFRVALRGPAATFRRALGLPRDCDELGVVCPDVVEAAAYLTKTYPGMGPFFLGEGSPKVFTTDGRVHPYRTRVGFGYYHDLLIELAEPGDGSDIFATHLDPGGRITLHHLGFFGRGPDLEIEIDDEKRGFRAPLAALGYRPRWDAQVALAGVVGHVTIFDTYDRADGLGTEFLDFRIGAVDGIPTVMPRGPTEALAWLQIKHGPRVLELPSPRHPAEHTWDHELSNAHLPAPGGVAWEANKAGKVAVFRAFADGEWSYLKIKGTLAWELYRGMTRCEPNARDSRRRGVHMLASLDNVIDGPVVEVRLRNVTRQLGLYPSGEHDLDHSVAPNREVGKARREGDTLVLTGDAARGLNRWLGRTGARVVFDLVALQRGELRLR